MFHSSKIALLWQMRVVLLCGYRRTGKDTFCQILQGNCDRHYTWHAYAKPDASVKDLRSPGMVFQHKSFAQQLKFETAKEYGIPEVVSDDDKDVKQYLDPETNDIVSARDLYIKHGALRRSQDRDYWCSRVFESITDANVQDQSLSYVITDWRFPNEHTYTVPKFSDVMTVRLWNSDVPEPPADIESEHALDAHATDLLLIPDYKPREFQRAVQKFPQYANYEHVGEY